MKFEESENIQQAVRVANEEKYSLIVLLAPLANSNDFKESPNNDTKESSLRLDNELQETIIATIESTSFLIMHIKSATQRARAKTYSKEKLRFALAEEGTYLLPLFSILYSFLIFHSAESN